MVGIEAQAVFTHKTWCGEELSPCAVFSALVHRWTKSYEGLDVTLYGTQKDEATVMTWNDGTADYGVTYQGLGGDELSMNDSECAEVVKAVKEANAEKKEEEKQQEQQEQQNTEGFSKGACTANALASVGAGDSATNVTTSERITGGGTDYYLVEFDLDNTHFRVQVDALDGTIIDVTEIVDGVAVNYDENGNVMNTTEVN